MGFRKEKVGIVLTESELLHLFLGYSVTTKTLQETKVALSGISCHRALPGMLEGESVMHEIETQLTYEGKVYKTNGLLKLDLGCNTYSGTFEFEIYPDNLSE